MKRLAAAVVTLACAFVVPAQAEVRRFGLLVSSNEGRSDDPILRYAERDARRLRDALEDVASFRREDTVLLAGAGADDVVRALTDLQDRMRIARERGSDTLLLFYYSGHADERSLHLGRTALPMTRVHDLLESSRARIRLAILDACRSGGFSRLKGGRPAPAFDIRLEGGLRGEGHVTLTSSAADEDSQESDRLGGSFFTHHLVSGLRGAADRSGDGQVTLAELYRYAYHNTVRATQGTRAGAQHPGYRYDVRGHGDLLLGRLDDPQATRLAVKGPGRWLVSDERTEEVAAEFSTGPRGGYLVVKPGRYRVSRRDQDALLETVVRLEPGGGATLAPDDFERIAYARLVRKGGPDASAVAHGLHAGLGWQSQLEGLSGDMLFAQVGYAVDLRWLTVRLLARLGESAGRTPMLDYQLGQVGMALQVVHLVDLALVSLGAGMTTGLTWFDQRLGAGEEDRQALGLSFGGIVLAGVEVADGLSLVASGEAGTVTFPRTEVRMAPVDDGTLESAFSWRGALGVRHAF